MKTYLNFLFLTVVGTFVAANEVQGQNPAVDDLSFSSYASGWECARTSIWSENRFWLNNRPDTTYYPGTGHPNQRSTVANTVKCNARFNLASTVQRNLLGLMEANLAAEQNSEADAAAAKLISSLATASPERKAWWLYQISDIYLSAPKPRLQKAEECISKLDAMGVSAAPERMLAHKRLAAVASFRDSVPLWDREITAALKASKQITGDTKKEYALASASVYLDVARLKGRVNEPQAAIQVIEEGAAELIPVRKKVSDSLNSTAQLVYTMMGQEVSQIQATRWYNSPGDNVHPRPGKPALLVFATKRCGNWCPGLSVLRRLKSKFEANGLDIVIVTRTDGFHENRLVTPDSETIFINDYFTTSMELPVNLAVWQADFGHRKDGKLTVLSDPNCDALRCGSYYWLTSYLIDSKGKIRFIFEMDRNKETTVENIIASLL